MTASMENDDWKVKTIAAFGVLCVTLLLLQAVVRLSGYALAPIRDGSLSQTQLVLYALWVVFQAYAEGYRGFQLRFSPRVVGRAVHLGRFPRPLHVVFALPFCMSLFHATRRQLITRWVFTTALVALIVAVKLLPQPWRGIIDGGVVVGLVWGIVVLWWYFGRFLLGYPAPDPVDLPVDLQASRNTKTI